MEIDLERIRSVVKQLEEIANETKITISISAYSDSLNIRPSVFLHDNSDADTDYYDDMTVSHCTDSYEKV
jgi:hypothetical protein